MTLEEALAVFFKRRSMIIKIFLLIMSTVAFVTFLERPVYEAKSSILVKPMTEDTARPGILPDKNDGGAPLLSQEELVNTEIQILTGEELIGKVIKTVGLAKIYPDLAKKASNGEAKEAMFKAVQTFQKNLKVVGVRKSDVVAVTFQHDNPEIAARAVNLLVEFFEDKHLAVHSDPQSDFTRTQLAVFEEKLRASEKNLQEYQQKNNVFSLDDQRALLLRQRSDFDSAYKLANDSISETNKRIASLKSAVKYASRTDQYTRTDHEKTITDAKSRLLELQLKQQELERKYAPGNRLVVDAKRDVDLVNGFVKDQEQGIASKVKTGNPVYQSVEMDLLRAQADLSSQMAKAEALKGQLTQLDKEIEAFNLSEGKIQELKREVEVNEKNYKTYLDRHEESQISLAMNKMKMSNISVIETAHVPVKPIKPKIALNMALGLIFGVFAGITAAYLSEHLGDTFSDPKAIEGTLELPVLVSVPVKEQ